MNDIIQIDGAYGEGGGQIIRTSVSLAAMTGRAVEIHNVRGRRSKPGLQPQHLAAVRAAGELCLANLTGDSVGSRFLRFEPQSPVVAGRYRFEIGTAGAAPLVIQTVLMPLIHAGGASRISVSGGTHVPHAPTAEYLEAVYIPTLQHAGLDLEVSYDAAGFYPRGGGEMRLRIGESGAPAPLDLSERGALRELRAFVVTSNLPAHVAARGTGVIEAAMSAMGREVRIERRDKNSPGPGAAVILAAEYEGGNAGFSSVGEVRKPMEQVAAAPCEEWERWWKSGAACDEHLADQLILPMAFASGPSVWSTPEVTEHLRTVIWVVQQFLDVEVGLDESQAGRAMVTMNPAIGTP